MPGILTSLLDSRAEQEEDQSQEAATLGKENIHPSDDEMPSLGTATNIIGTEHMMHCYDSLVRQYQALREDHQSLSQEVIQGQQRVRLDGYHIRDVESRAQRLDQALIEAKRDISILEDEIRSFRRRLAGRDDALRQMKTAWEQEENRVEQLKSELDKANAQQNDEKQQKTRIATIEQEFKDREMAYRAEFKNRETAYQEHIKIIKQEIKHLHGDRFKKLLEEKEALTTENHMIKMENAALQEVTDSFNALELKDMENDIARLEKQVMAGHVESQAQSREIQRLRKYEAKQSLADRRRRDYLERRNREWQERLHKYPRLDVATQAYEGFTLGPRSGQANSRKPDETLEATDAQLDESFISESGSEQLEHQTLHEAHQDEHGFPLRDLVRMNLPLPPPGFVCAPLERESMEGQGASRSLNASPPEAAADVYIPMTTPYISPQVDAEPWNQFDVLPSPEMNLSDDTDMQNTLNPFDDAFEADIDEESESAYTRWASEWTADQDFGGQEELTPEDYEL